MGLVSNFVVVSFSRQWCFLAGLFWLSNHYSIQALIWFLTHPNLHFNHWGVCLCRVMFSWHFFFRFELASPANFFGFDFVYLIHYWHLSVNFHVQRGTDAKKGEPNQKIRVLKWHLQPCLSVYVGCELVLWALNDPPVEFVWVVCKSITTFANEIYFSRLFSTLCVCVCVSNQTCSTK